MGDRQSVTVMAGLRTVTVAPVQLVAAVTHRIVCFQLVMGVGPVYPLRRGFITGSPEVAGAAVGYKGVAVSTV